jgi:DNA-binding transcriptional regulator YdaS (Cro superfamily)
MLSLQTLIDDATKACQSQRKLAAALGITPPAISFWRSGAKACPLRHAVAMARLSGHSETEAILACTARKLARSTTAAAVGVLAMLGTFGGADRAQAAGDRGETTTMYRPVKSRWWLRWMPA